MIASFIASTTQVDEPEKAAADILAALDPEHNLLKYSLGLISCYSEFEETDALKAICDALPFDCIGATTCLCADGVQMDHFMFSITVLTSDDCQFQTISIPVGERYEESIRDTLNEIPAPALFLSYFPLMTRLSGDMMISAIDRVTGGTPLFGTSAVDHHLDYSTARTIYNGKSFREHIILGAVYGNPSVAFAVASLNYDKMRNQKAIITESDGNLLIGVNGKTALEYLEEIGLTKEELETGLGIIPFSVDYNNGTKPVARAIFTLTPEGYGVCGGAMPLNATLGIGHIDMADVLHTTQDTLKQLIEPNRTVIGYSCIARYFVLGIDNTAEAEAVNTMSHDAGLQFLFAYSGGEICPLPDGKGNLKNFYHNFSVAFCRLH